MYEVQSCWKGGCLGPESKDGRSASERSVVVVQDVLQQLAYGSFNPKKTHEPKVLEFGFVSTNEGRSLLGTRSS